MKSVASTDADNAHHHPSEFGALQTTMYKRFQKTLKASAVEDGSSSEEEEPKPVKELEELDQDDIDFAHIGGQADKPEDPNAGLEEVGVLTEGDLEGQDEADAEYRCSICPRKVLRSLDDVKKHLVAKEHLAKARKMQKLIEFAKAEDEAAANAPEAEEAEPKEEEEPKKEVKQPEEANRGKRKREGAPSGEEETRAKKPKHSKPKAKAK